MSPAGRFLEAVRLSDVPDGRMVGADVGGRRVLITNLGGTIYAVSGVCTHEEYDLSQGFVLEERVVCPLHLSQFDLRTGEVYNPPATLPLERFNVKIEEDVILVEV